MARTAVAITPLEVETSTPQPAGTSLDPTNDHIINAAFATGNDLIVDIDSTFEGAKVFTFLQRDGTKLDVSLNKARTKVVLDGKYKQDDGSVWIDVPAAATGTIRVYSLSKRVA